MTDTFVLSTGEEVPLIFSTRRGLRNITLRPKIAPRREIHISVPWLTSKSRAVKFIDEKQLWLEKIFARAPEKVKLKEGDIIKILDTDFLVSTRTLGGSPEFLERRARDAIKKILLSEIKKIVADAPAFYRPAKIALRDTVSRWGSCSSTGTVSFSWRLAFAPYSVMRYVVLHELAHKKHMDHSVKFWATVSDLYGPGVERAKLWLNKNGQSLHKYL